MGVEFLAERILMLPAMAIALSEDDTALFGEEEEREPRLLGFLVSFSDREGDGYCDGEADTVMLFDAGGQPKGDASTQILRSAPS